VPKLRWFTWAGLLAAGIASWGLIWLAISSYLVQAVRRFDWFTPEMGPSTGGRVMALLAAVFLAVAGAVRILRD